MHQRQRETEGESVKDLYKRFLEEFKGIELLLFDNCRIQIRREGGEIYCIEETVSGYCLEMPSPCIERYANHDELLKRLRNIFNDRFYLVPHRNGKGLVINVPAEKFCNFFKPSDDYPRGEEMNAYTKALNVYFPFTDSMSMEDIQREMTKRGIKRDEHVQFWSLDRDESYLIYGEDYEGSLIVRYCSLAEFPGKKINRVYDFTNHEHKYAFRNLLINNGVIYICEECERCEHSVVRSERMNIESIAYDKNSLAILSGTTELRFK